MHKRYIVVVLAIRNVPSTSEPPIEPIHILWVNQHAELNKIKLRILIPDAENNAHVPTAEPIIGKSSTGEETLGSVMPSRITMKNHIARLERVLMETKARIPLIATPIAPTTAPHHGEMYHHDEAKRDHTVTEPKVVFL